MSVAKTSLHLTIIIALLTKEFMLSWVVIDTIYLEKHLRFENFNDFDLEISK